MNNRKPLPSISPSKIRSINTPVVSRTFEFRSSVTCEPSRDGSRIRAWRSPDIEEQHRLYLQAQKEQTFWNIRMRNRP
jgi:hypothetical protein